jgi:hypothetical protein
MMPHSFGLLRGGGARRGRDAAALKKDRKRGTSISMKQDRRLGFVTV